MRVAAPGAVIAAILAGALAAGAPVAAAAPLQAAAPRPTATPIKHFLFLMQAGRTFDNYFGSYPGADGLPAGACQPLGPAGPGSGCVRPFLEQGKPPPTIDTSALIAARQYDNGRMDGFVAAYRQRRVDGRSVMGYYDQMALPFYWTVARDYVLFDHFFSAALCCTRTNLSEWIAARPAPGGPAQPTIFDRLQAAGVSWKFYVQGDHAPAARAAGRAARIPLLAYRRFVKDPVLSSHIVDLNEYYRDAAAGTLPAVAFIVGSPADNERSPRTLAAGQSLVRSLVTQLMESREWDNSALLWSYDGSGGLYDHVPPPRSGPGTLGFRVPALLVSAYARPGQVNHAVLSYASALRFIEQNWGLAPLTRQDASATSLDSAFDFSAGPRPPDILAPVTSSAAAPAGPRNVPVVLIYLLYGSAVALAVALVAWAQRSAPGEQKGVPEA